MKRRAKQPAGVPAKRAAKERPLSPGYERIRQVVSTIPRGRVMTYGDVARAAGMPGAARQVGYAMHSLGKSVPWQRVLGRKNPRSGHSTINDPQARARQQQLLESEGVRFSASGGVDLTTFGWAPRAPAKPKPRSLKKLALRANAQRKR
ncbi:MAG TPA: MGMT family protein [Polyangiaceae bacterium]|jgi:methylated-DNA-protein-cysteine methyltransferase-like protein|nr:MGMT family protein [Polyangiaceae bacterium]